MRTKLSQMAVRPRAWGSGRDLAGSAYGEPAEAAAAPVEEAQPAAVVPFPGNGAAKPKEHS